MVNNAAKALMSPFSSEVEGFCSDIYCDVEKSPKQKEIFAEFLSLLHLPVKSLIRPISNCFLWMEKNCPKARLDKIEANMDNCVLQQFPEKKFMLYSFL